MCDAECAVGTGLLVGLPSLVVAAALATDVGTAVHLARGRGTVPRAWSVAGLALWSPAVVGFGLGTVFSAVALASPDLDQRAGGRLGLGLSVPGLVLGVGSLVLQGYALRFRSAEAAAEPVARAWPAFYPVLRLASGASPAMAGFGLRW